MESVADLQGQPVSRCVQMPDGISKPKDWKGLYAALRYRPTKGAAEKAAKQTKKQRAASVRKFIGVIISGAGSSEELLCEEPSSRQPRLHRHS